MVTVEISLEAFQPTTSNILIVHKFEPPLHSAGVFPWTSRVIKLDYMSLVPMSTVKHQDTMHVFLGGFSRSLYIPILQVFTFHVHTLIASG